MVNMFLFFKILVWKELDYGKMTEAEKKMLVSEVNLLRELKHPHIVRYYDRIIDRSNTTIYIVMEYCEGGDLGALIARHRREKYVTTTTTLSYPYIITKKITLITLNRSKYLKRYWRCKITKKLTNLEVNFTKIDCNN